MRVLVLEGDAHLSEAIEGVLTGAGHKVSTAHDGDTAAALLGQDEALPEVIILNLMMADAEGQRFRQRQLADPRLAPIPTLMMTDRPIGREAWAECGPSPSLRNAIDTLVAAMHEVVRPQADCKQCHCCSRVYDSDTWHSLPIVGEIDNGREVGERLELRQCACKSTLAWEVGNHALSVPILRIRS